MDAIHRAASHHTALHEEWYDENYFDRFDSSALLAFGYLAEELMKEMLLKRSNLSEHPEGKKRSYKEVIAEFASSRIDSIKQRDPELSERVKRWREIQMNPQVAPFVNLEKSPSPANQNAPSAD